MTTDVLFVALDGADPTLINQWTQSGDMPVLNELMQNWQTQPVLSPPGFGDGVFWTSLYTGCNAGRHAHYFPWQFNPQTYQTDTFVYDLHFMRDPFWLYASKMGRRVGIVDLYTAPLLQGLDGVQVMDWMIHDRTAKPRSWPEPVIESLHENFMPDPLRGNSEEIEARSEIDWVQMHEGICSRIRAKADAVGGMLSGNEWDLFAVGFCDAHDIGHQSWHWHDPSAPNHPGEWVGRHGNPVLQTYRELDAALEKVISSAGAREVFLVAGIGMGMQTTCNPAFDEMLAHFSGHAGNRQQLRERVAERPYFALSHNMNSGALRINLKGRERMGIVEPDDYDRVCDELEENLRGITDAESGIPVVDHCVRIRKAFKGDHTDRLPDMMVVWQRQRRVTRLKVPGRDDLEIVPHIVIERRSGDHTPDAMLVSSQFYGTGPDIDPDLKIPVESIAPTVGRALGIRIPGLDQKPLRKVA